MNVPGHGPGGNDPFARNPFDQDPFGGPHPPLLRNPVLPPQLSGRGTNTLATLSVVFAFVFAPVGAVLGHLGLAEIRRSGQRGRDRALVGLTTSYAFIVIAVVALVVWAVTRDNPAKPAVSAAPTASVTLSAAAASPTKPSTTRPNPASLAVPVMQPGPTTEPASLTALLLTGEEVAAHIGVAGMHVAHSASEQFDEAVSPENCGPIYREAGGTEYRGSGFTSESSQSVIDSARPCVYIVGQAVFSFPTVTSAQTFLANEAAAWSSCANTDASMSDGGKLTHLTHIGQPRSDGVVLTVTNEMTAPPATCQRAITGRGNVVVDVSLCGPKVDAETVAMARDIARKIG